MVQDHQISILEVETIQLVTCAFRVHHIFIDHECRAFGLVVYALSDLPDRSELAKEIEEVLSADVVVEVLHKECSTSRLVSFLADRVGLDIPVHLWSKLGRSTHGCHTLSMYLLRLIAGETAFAKKYVGSSGNRDGLCSRRLSGAGLSNMFRMVNNAGMNAITACITSR